MSATAVQDLSEVHDTQKHDLGTLHFSQGKAYMYIKGVASLASGEWITVDEGAQAARLAANAKGRVGVAMAAIVANKYGWAQVYGKNTSAVAGDVADNGDLYATATAGSVDDAVVAGDRIKGAWARSADSGGVITVELNFPYMDDIAD